jgi:hypothetical protein
MSVQVSRKHLISEMWLSAILLVLLVITWDARHTAQAEVYTMHDKEQRLIYSNTPVVSSPTADIQCLTKRPDGSNFSETTGNGDLKSNIKKGEDHEGSEAREEMAKMKKGNTSGKSSARAKIKSRVRSDSLNLPSEGGI